MNEGDVFGTLGWGLRKYAWLVALIALGLGILVPFVLSRGADVYEAKAQVALVSPSSVALSIDTLPRAGVSTFDNGAVANAVGQALGLKSNAGIVPNRVDLIAAQDNFIFEIVGKDPNPKRAADIANVAAAAFQTEMNKYTNTVGNLNANRKLTDTTGPLGAFAITRQADVPTAPAPKLHGGLALGIGLLGGLAAGVGVVAALLAWRRPVVDADSAGEVTATPVLGRVRLPTRRFGRASPVGGIAALCRRIRSGGEDLILLTSQPQVAEKRHELAAAMSDVFGASRPVQVVAGGSLNRTYPNVERSHLTREQRHGQPPQITIVDGPTPDEVAARPDSSLLILVVEEGLGVKSLRESAEEQLDDGPTGLVFLLGSGWGLRVKSGSARKAPGTGSTASGYPAIEEPTD